MLTRLRVGTPAGLSVLFVLLAGIPLAALGWLGSRLLAQERELERQQRRELLENSTAVLMHEIDRSLSRWEDAAATEVNGAGVTLPAGTVRLVFDRYGVLRNEGVRLPYLPAVAAEPLPGRSDLAAAAAAEFQADDPSAASSAYRRVVAATADRSTRAAALLGLGRCLRKQSKVREAIAVYEELAKMLETPAAGFPAELVARKELITLRRSTGDEAGSQREAEGLSAALFAGHFRIDRATFDLFAEALPAPKDRATLAQAAAVNDLWPIVQQQAEGRNTITSHDRAIAAVWRRRDTTSAAIIGPVETLMATVSPVARDLHVGLTLEDSTGHRIWGTTVATDVTISRSLREAGLPWTIRVTTGEPSGVGSTWLSRQNLLASGFGLMALVVATASYVVFRSVNRELGVARLQSEFVAAVSHEFRTPLTAMRHLTEMLEEGASSPDRLPQYYRALGKETRRLHGLVENLLDFGRIEAGRRVYRMEDTDAVSSVAHVVEEFRESGTTNGHQLDLAASTGPLPIRADRDALALALRNLLDNAVKYSPESSTITISVRRENGFVGISVEDRGAGIPKQEQRQVFRRFVRGSSSRAMNVQGTGIGLAMVEHIAKAHGGRVEVESEPGVGSTFTIALPSAERSGEEAV